MTTKRDQRGAASWVFGGAAFVILALAIFVLRRSLAEVDKPLGVFVALLAGLFGYFFTGTIVIRLDSARIPKIGKFSVKATGGVALFILALWWWRSGENPEALKKLNQIMENQKGLASGAFYAATFVSKIAKAGNDPVGTRRDALSELATEAGTTEERIRDEIFQAAATAEERKLLAVQVRANQEKELKRVSKIERDASLELGAVAFIKHDWKAAATQYQDALRLTDSNEEDKLWIHIQLTLARVLSDSAGGVDDPSDRRALTEAVAACQGAIKKSEELGYQDQWISANNTLGTVSWRGCVATANVTEALNWANQAVLAFRRAAGSINRDVNRRNWGVVQMNLGVALRHQRAFLVVIEKPTAETTMAEKAERLRKWSRLRDECEHSFENALSSLTREEFPTDWARAHKELGFTLSTYALEVDKDAKEDMLNRASQHFQLAEKVFTEKDYPEEHSSVESYAKLMNDQWAGLRRGSR